MPETIKEAIEKPQARPAQIALIAGVVWKIYEWAKGVDFILSIPYRPYAVALQNVIGGPGPLVFIAGCVIWWVVVANRPRSAKRPRGWTFALGAAIPAFAVGAITTATPSNPPRLMLSYQRVGG